MSPIDKSLIKVNLLDPKERGWLNDYHKEVFKEISPFLDNSQKSWLQICCSPTH